MLIFQQLTSLDGLPSSVTSNITLYMYGPERTLTGSPLSSFKRVVWNYVD